MSAEVLRRAAALMRERAEDATPSPWTFDQEGVNAHEDTFIVVHGAAVDSDENDPDLEHIASWHPAVALAVADWLDAVDRAARLAGVSAEHPEALSIRAGALTVARAYLGESA